MMNAFNVSKDFLNLDFSLVIVQPLFSVVLMRENSDLAVWFFVCANTSCPGAATGPAKRREDR
jgi:hypothetical protein